MFLDSLLQYNSDTRQFLANVRFNLIHRPLSDLFVVYNEGQQAGGFFDWIRPQSRSLVVKFTKQLGS